MSAAQIWNPESYARNARFVSDLGMPVFELLAPKPGERVLDLGCGDGVLTKKLVEAGCSVVGVDSSDSQIEAAMRFALDARVMDGHSLQFDSEFDAVFSNAALHWMKRPEQVVASVWRALKPGGRFVAEFGGYGCVSIIRSALTAALIRRGFDPAAVNPWYFPTAEQYRALLESSGFAVDYIALIPRQTPLPGDISGWLETFAESFLFLLPAGERAGYIDEVREALRPELCDSDGRWTADYVRLRFEASKDETGAGSA